MGTAYNPKIVTDGLAALVDFANPKSFSPNVFPSGQDIYSWYVSRNGNNIGNFCTVEQDFTTSKSPAGGIPMKMNVTGNDPYIGSYNTSTWNISTAATGQVWVISVWVKASVATTVESPLVFEVNSSGNFTQVSSNNIAVTTEWQRISTTRTFTNATTAFIQMRLDGPQTGGTGQTIWWDGLQVEPFTLTNFNSFHNPNYSVATNLVSPQSVTVSNRPQYNNSGFMDFDGVNDSVTVALANFFTSYSQEITIESWINVPSSATWNNANEGVIVGRGNYGGSHGLFRTLVNNQIKAWFRQSDATYGAVSAIGSITRDTWNQCVAVWTGSSAKLYINGTLIQTSNGTLGSNINNEPFVIGGNNTAGGAEASYYTGKIANVKIYNRALLDAEVATNFAATRRRFGI